MNMPDSATATEHLIDDPAAALFFIDAYKVRHLHLFLSRERSLSEAAQILEVSKSRMSYWVKKLLELKFIHIVRVEKRGRYRVPIYRSTADVFLVPLELLPVESDEKLLSLQAEAFDKSEKRSLAHFGRKYADGWHVRYAGADGRGQLSIVPRSGDMEDAEIFNFWGRLRLTEQDAKALRQDMRRLLGSYLEKASSDQKSHLFKLLLVRNGSSNENASTLKYSQYAILVLTRLPMQVNVLDTETQLLELLEKVQAGEEVILFKDDKPVAKLSSFKPAPRPGRMKGKIWMADDFDKTDQDIIDSFYNSKLFPDE